MRHGLFSVRNDKFSAAEFMMLFCKMMKSEYV